MTPVYSLVVPIFNEEAVMPLLLRRLDALMDALDAPAEAILVDDGSRDAWPIVLEAKARADARYRFVKPVAQFRPPDRDHHRHGARRGQAVIVMDADLQDPPEVVLDMIAKWKEGYRGRLRPAPDARRRKPRSSASPPISSTACSAGSSEVDIPRNVGDFRLVDRKALDAFLAMPERDRFVRGMFAWIGFRQAVVKFHRPPRAAGETQIFARQDGAARGERRRFVLRRAAAARAVGGPGDLVARHPLRPVGHRACGR